MRIVGKFSVLVRLFAAAIFLLVAGSSSAFAQTTVTATWDRNTDQYTAGYRVYYGTSSGNYQWSLDAGNQVSAPVTLSPGSIYYFTVRGYNAQYQEGPPSNEATVDLRTQTPAPTATISATLGANNIATVTWSTTNAVSATINNQAVALSGQTTVAVTGQTTFTLVARAADGRTATWTATVTPTTTPAPTAWIGATLGANNIATVTWQTTNAATATINNQAVGLSGQTTVAVTGQTTFTLVARAADGRTATWTATVTPTATPAPTAQITATLQGSNTAVVTWQTANAATASINGQTVGLSGNASVTITATTTFTITARAADGRTATASATVTLQAPSAPGSPRTLTASVSGSRATLAWQAPTTGGATTHYVIDVGTKSGKADVLSNYNVGNVLSTFGDLARGTYYARVRAANASGVSGYSNEVQFTIGRRLRSPTNVSVKWTGTTATVSWVPSSADSAADVPTNYVLEAGTAPGERNVATLSVGNTTTFTTEVPSGIYYVRIKAENAEGESVPSEDIEVRAPGTPEAPRELIQSGSGAHVILLWYAPKTGTAPTGYVIEAGSAPGLADLASIQVGDVGKFETMAPPGTYHVRVRSLNARGLSTPSNEIVVRR